MTYQIEIPDIDDKNLDEQIAKISESDRELMARINMLLPFLSWSEKMAAGLHAFWLIDTSHTQLCEIRGRHGFF
jgi:hypothetical protein